MGFSVDIRPKRYPEESPYASTLLPTVGPIDYRLDGLFETNLRSPLCGIVIYIRSIHREILHFAWSGGDLYGAETLAFYGGCQYIVNVVRSHSVKPYATGKLGGYRK